MSPGVRQRLLEIRHRGRKQEVLQEVQQEIREDRFQVEFQKYHRLQTGGKRTSEGSVKKRQNTEPWKARQTRNKEKVA